MVTESDPDGPIDVHAPRPRTRSTTSSIGGDWVAFGTVGSPPNVSDLDRGRRIGNREDYQNLLRLAQLLNSSTSCRATRSSPSTSITASGTCTRRTTP